MATTKEATPNSNAAVRDLDWMLVMGSLLCAKSAPTTSAPFSAPRLCASTRKVSHNEKLESDAFQAPREITPHSRRIMGDGRVDQRTPGIYDKMLYHVLQRGSAAV